MIVEMLVGLSGAAFLMPIMFKPRSAQQLSASYKKAPDQERVIAEIKKMLPGLTVNEVTSNTIADPSSKVVSEIIRTSEDAWKRISYRFRVTGVVLLGLAGLVVIVGAAL